MVIDFDVTTSRNLRELRRRRRGIHYTLLLSGVFRLSAPLGSYSIPTSISNDVVILLILKQVIPFVSLR